MSFEAAAEIFLDPFQMTDQDRIEGGEYRWQTLGLDQGSVLLMVAHTVREDDGDEVIRIISARRATSRERRRYEQDG